MTIQEAMLARHSVRQFEEGPLKEAHMDGIMSLIRAINQESGLHIQLILDDPDCFDTFWAHYGKFSGARHYLALVGQKNRPDLQRLCGYYGEKLVLEVQRMGLNTCWVAGSYDRRNCQVKKAEGEKLVCIIALGYGLNDGRPHRSKALGKLCNLPEDAMPDWFRAGMEAALLAPTAINQQRFYVILENDQVRIKDKRGPYSQIDLGIVQYHFEVGSGRKVLTTSS